MCYRHTKRGPHNIIIFIKTVTRDRTPPLRFVPIASLLCGGVRRGLNSMGNTNGVPSNDSETSSSGSSSGSGRGSSGRVSKFKKVRMMTSPRSKCDQCHTKDAVWCEDLEGVKINGKDVTVSPHRFCSPRCQADYYRFDLMTGNDDDDCKTMMLTEADRSFNQAKLQYYERLVNLFLVQIGPSVTHNTDMDIESVIRAYGLPRLTRRTFIEMMPFMACSNQTILIGKRNRLYVCGRNKGGELGLGDHCENNTRLRPISLPVDDETEVSLLAVSCASNQTMVLTTNGLYGCGSNTDGRLGIGGTSGTNGDTTTRQNDAVLTRIPIENVVSMSCAETCTMAIKLDGSLFVTGSGVSGQLGLGTGVSSKRVFTPVEPMKDVVLVCCGDGHSAAITKDGLLWTTGSNISGELGLGDTVNRYLFEQVLDVTDVISVSCGQSFTMVIRRGGSLWAAGLSSYGQLGLASMTPSFKRVIENGVTRVSCGARHTMIIKEDNTLWATGRNNYGQLGTGDTTDRSTFVYVMGHVASVTCGVLHTLITKVDGTVWSVGSNRYGQLGLGKDVSQSITFEKVNFLVPLTKTVSCHVSSCSADAQFMMMSGAYDDEDGLCVCYEHC